jgi:hypothetical protein
LLGAFTPAISSVSDIPLAYEYLVALWPAHQLEQLTGLAGRFYTGHQLCQRDNLLVDLKDPGPEKQNIRDYHMLG